MNAINVVTIITGRHFFNHITAITSLHRYIVALTQTHADSRVRANYDYRRAISLFAAAVIVIPHQPVQ